MNSVKLISQNQQSIGAGEKCRNTSSRNTIYDSSPEFIIKNYKMSDRWLAEKLHIDPHTVGNFRQLLIAQKKIPDTKKTMGADGRIRKYIRKYKLLEYNEKGFVYFIKNLNNGLMKIGYTTTSPERRFQQIKSIAKNLLGENCNLKLVYFTNGSRKLEKKLHNKCKQNRVFGEWFNIDFII